MASVDGPLPVNTSEASHENTVETPLSKNETFDYVIVGGGTAGLTLAARLIERSLSTVAVIEAGGSYEEDSGKLSTIPGYCFAKTGVNARAFNLNIDWGFTTEPQKAVNDRRLGYPQGKTLGGSSARNYLYYHRPNAGAFEKWAEEVGDDGYGFEKFMPYYKRSVQYTPPTVPFPEGVFSQDPEAWSETGGPLQLCHGAHVDLLVTYIQPAVRRLGFTHIDGFSSGKLDGSGYVPYTIDPETMQRSSSESSFLNLIRDHPRFKLYEHTLVEQVGFDKDMRAVGVLVSANGTKTKVRASKEVILSAGVFGSPKLLMLSGIGPKSKLEPFGIDVHIDLPGVGENLTDHPFISTTYRVNVPTASEALRDPTVAAANEQKYREEKAGPLTISASGFTFWEKLPFPHREKFSPSSHRELDSLPADWPELEYLTASAHASWRKDPQDGFNYACIIGSLAAPLSRGSVSLRSANPADLPFIDPNFFSHPADITVAIAAIRRMRQIWAGMDKSVVDSEYFPGALVKTDNGLFEYVKESLTPTNHGACTCKMGKKEDKMAVVDHEARVFGTTALRVVDASAFPFLAPGHPQSTVYALAEKIADTILEHKWDEDPVSDS